MPRELVHWKILEDAVRQLPVESARNARQCLEQQQAAAYLGAIAHDGPFYYKNGSHPFEQVAEIMHGKYGGDTFAPLRRAAQHIVDCDESNRPVLWAFFLGLLSHVVTDTIFHPMVYYFTGNYNSLDPEERRKARIRHRILEVHLDSWVRKDLRLWNNFSIDVLNKSLGGDAETIYQFLDSCVVPALIESAPQAQRDGVLEGADAPGLWKAGIEQMAYYQRMFLSPWYGAAAKVVRLFAFSRFDAVEALFSLGRGAPPTLFEELLEYSNPVTGEPNSATISELLTRANEECVRLFAKCDPLISGASRSVEEILGAEVGKSLDFGIIRETIEPPTHFSPVGLPLPGLQIR